LDGVKIPGAVIWCSKGYGEEIVYVLYTDMNGRIGIWHDSWQTLVIFSITLYYISIVFNIIIEIAIFFVVFW